MPEHPLISIITATYNCREDLEKCLQSLAAQSYRGFEHIIVDGGSTDGTLEVIEKNQTSLGWWISEPDRGIYNAWNKALAHIKGEWVLFLGADDTLYSPDTLSEIAPILAQQPKDLRTVYGKLESVDEEGNVIAIAGRGRDIDHADFINFAKPLPHPSMLQRREVFKELGGFDEGYRISADFDFMCRELLEHQAEFADIFITVHLLRGVSVHPKTALKSWQETLKIIRAHKLPVPLRFKFLRITKAAAFYLGWLILPDKIILPLIDRLRKSYWKNR